MVALVLNTLETRASHIYLGKEAIMQNTKLIQPCSRWYQTSYRKRVSMAWKISSPSLKLYGIKSLKNIAK